MAWAMAKAIVNLDYMEKETEDETDYLDRMSKELEYIRLKTHRTIQMPIATLEFIFNRDKHRVINKPYDIAQKEFYLYDITVALFEAFSQIISMIAEISLRNSVPVQFDLGIYAIPQQRQMRR